MTAPTQRPAATSDARKRLAERGASATLVAELIGCKGCRNAGITAPAEPGADEREALIALLLPSCADTREKRDWPHVARRQAEKIADRLIAAGYSRTPGAHLAAAKAEALREAGAKVAAMRNGATGRRVTNAEYLGQVVYAMGDDIEYQAARAARLREQGGE